MSSGHFPLEYKFTGAGETLRKVADELKRIKSEYYSLSCEDNNREDATSDGCYLGYLQIATELIERCIWDSKC